MNWRRLSQIVKLLLLVILLGLIIAPEWPAFADEKYRLREIVNLREFDYLVWESNALFNKGEALLAGGLDIMEVTFRTEAAAELE